MRRVRAAHRLVPIGVDSPPPCYMLLLPYLGWPSRDVEKMASGINGSCPEPLGAEGLTGLLRLLYCTVANTVDDGIFVRVKDV